MILDIDATITSPTLENLTGKILACKNTFIDTLVIQVTGDCLMMYQLHWALQSRDQRSYFQKS